jgi:beta-lactamase class D
MGCLSKSLLFIALSMLLLTFSCQNKDTNDTEKDNSLNDTNRLINDDFQSIIDSNNVKGSILIYNSKLNEYYSNNFERAKTGFLPASTFKVVNSIIGLETGVIKGKNHLFKWDRTPQQLKAWEADLTLAEAYKRSCVPCYKKVARRIGVDSMNFYLQKLNYGNQIIPDSLIDLFWLVGDFQISQFQQIDFLQRLHNQELPISKRTYGIMQQVMLMDTNENYKLSGKTGWAIREGNNIGWFIGFIETADNIFYIATNVTPNNEVGLENFGKIRLKIALDAFEKLVIK